MVAKAGAYLDTPFHADGDNLKAGYAGPDPGAGLRGDRLAPRGPQQWRDLGRFLH